MKKPASDSASSLSQVSPLTEIKNQVVPTQQLKLRRSLLANLLVFAAGCGILAFAGLFLYRHLTTVRSRDAVINGVIVNVRAPEEGTLQQLRAKVGQFIKPAEETPLAVLENAYLSQGNLKEVEKWLERRQGELEAAQAKLAQLQGLLASAQGDERHQQLLEVKQTNRQVAAAQAELGAAKANLADAKARYRLAKINYGRFSRLAQQGAVPQAQADAALTELQQSQAQVAARQREVEAAADRVEALKADARAAELGLTLRNTRSNYDPRLRLQELKIQISEQQAIVQGLKREIAAQQRQVAQAWQEVAQRKVVKVTAPIAGYVWRVDARPGMFLGKGDQILQLLDCQRRWIDVFVEEQSLRLIHPGTKAKIELYGSKGKVVWGTVTNIRSGLGRLNPGDDQVIPIPENYPRQSQVRVELDADQDWGEGNFCYVGYTARVTFQISP
ncbi:HlyD family efflux transporter periplasmic adaptor subunit [Thermosynechococcus sp. PKX82]|uniref:HlyD family secretion protein n=1 Tax=Thermosynechococcus sp. PKX82 TaxID=3074086 RepID=UPI0028733B21|nr:HlyD family efflux transporter periplasmic adaptor subunit [Thermosynechococcus sp. PKX82]WNC30857.1 HlyD family efflux transporter periplasmic adaptor subunit [Thermosynechococcus sp. PKX82]